MFQRCGVEIKKILPIFGSNWLHFCFYKLSASKNNLSEYTEGGGKERHYYGCTTIQIHRVQISKIQFLKNI